MIKTALLAILTPTLIQAVSDGYDWICEALGCDEEDSKAKPKRPDRTALTPPMRKRISAEYRAYLKTGKAVDGYVLHNLQELTEYLNNEFKLNKSKSAYANVWRLNK